MRSTQGNHRYRRVTTAVAGRAHADGGMGVEQVLVPIKHFTNGVRGALVIHRVTVKQFPGMLPAVLFDADRALGGILQQVLYRSAVATVQVEQQALEIAGHHDVHAWRQGMLKLELLVAVAAHKAMQDVVTVGGNHQLGNWQSHFLGKIARENVAEVTRGYRERHAPIRPAERQGCMKVVYDLGHDAGPVNGIHRRKLRLTTEE